jgi:hypothetical protein
MARYFVSLRACILTSSTSHFIFLSLFLGLFILEGPVYLSRIWATWTGEALRLVERLAVTR